MEIRFVRKEGQRDHIYVRRADGSETSWVFPTYGDQLPHDGVHLVVEAAFGVADGFWGRVEAGVDVARINAQANQQGGADKYQGFGGDLGGLYLAEALAGERWSAPELSDAELRDSLVAACERSQLPVPAGLTLERIAQVRAVLERLRTRWRALVPKGTLVLSFSSKDLDGTFRAMESLR
jgi:hypothetical protein